jgi:Skp family chaperone for outer membrane proteins
MSLVLLALLIPAALAQAQEPRVGVVDMAKVLEGYKEFQDSDQQYKTFLAERQQQLQERMAVRLLSEEELKEYQNLKAVAAPADEQKKRLEQLRAVAETRENELNTLSRLPSPSEEEKKRLSDLKAVADKSSAEIEQLQKRLSDEINARNKELSEKLNQKIEAALAAVAKDKRVDLILAKDAVLYGGRDLTDEVLTKLNAAS